ncbi:glycosyltransferase family 2 protein [Gorillibacterium sp. sgz500922]|uniref:glycosyltransferase family 2 protein n=1 Tax=Gorillibacterium sp. sgz500922 TaxID=3446694 RepID=UPI003F6611A9
MGILVSIVVPVYNAERYLAECLDSLLNQTLAACEFICVDDGSQDASPAILDAYRQRDGRIRVIRQDNAGVSAARNRGLAEVRGAFIGFADADDTVRPDYFERLYRTAAADGCDIVVSTFASEQEGRIVQARYPFPADAPMDREAVHRDVLPYFLREDNLNAVWTKLYRTELIHRHRVRFPVGVALGEDARFNLEAFAHAASVRFLDYLGYRYRDVPGSATRNILAKDYFARALDVYETRLPAFEAATGLPEDSLRRQKAVKLIHSVQSYIYLYFTPTPGVPFRRRFAYVRRMVGHAKVKEALALYWAEKYPAAGRYERCVLWLMKRRLTAGLYAASAYSRMRNNGNRRQEAI